MREKSVIFTLGHSTRLIEEFIGLLRSCEIEKVVDVRTIPRSRHNPQFNVEALRLSLRENGIGYVHMKGLGGLRHPVKDSVNAGWHNPSFRGFADYMQTEEFEETLEKLMEMAKKKRLSLMCAEALPWRCHRSLIADALIIRGMEVTHILSSASLRLHTMTSFAKVRRKRITYPG